MLIYQYSGGMDGFLTAVFRIYEEKKVPDLITCGEAVEYPLSATTVGVQPEAEKALRQISMRERTIRDIRFIFSSLL